MILRVDLLEELLRAGVAPGDVSVSDRARIELARATERDWTRALTELRTHRLLPLVAVALRRLDLSGAVPIEAVEELEGSFRQTLLANALQLGLLRDLLEALHAIGVRPVVMKGLAVAARYYPDLGARPMVDIDLLVRDAEDDAAQRVFVERGFRRTAPWRSFLHPSHEFAVDLHTTGTDSRWEIRDDRTTPFDLDDRALAWEPNAMLAHLVAHLRKHLRVVGVSLLWVVDVLLLVQAERDALDLQKVEAVARDAADVQLLGQVLRFGRSICGIEVPPAFDALTRGSQPLSLAWLLRQRRLKAWGFPHRSFYVRYPARLLRLRPYGTRPRLRWSDVPQGWLDLTVDRRTCTEVD